jgi:NDP-sugar pyrophosphorylase family protein
MKVILQCPSDSKAVPALTVRQPLVLTPFLGQTVLAHALAGLAATGVKQVLLTIIDRPDEIRQAVSRGEAWGMEVTCSTETAIPASFEGASVQVLDRLPQLPEHLLWVDYGSWYTAQQSLLSIFAKSQVGMREVSPGVFVGHRSQIASDVKLTGPCWIGANVFIGPQVVIGPGTIIEDGCYIDNGAGLSSSIVGPRTYVGAYTEVVDSFAQGDRLLNLNNGSVLEINDHFLLDEVEPRRSNLSSLLKQVKKRLRLGPKSQTETTHQNEQSPAVNPEGR